MIYGNSLLGFGRCGFGLSNGYFSIWPYLIMIGVVLIIVAIIASRRSISLKNGDAMEKLKLLYVKGEITEEEYMNRKNVIERK